MYRVSFCKAAALMGSLLFCLGVAAQSGEATKSGGAGGDLRVVLIRHAEKPAKGYNLTCQGINRSLQLVPVLYSRFGLPSAIYVPALAQGDTTKHSRMFQTISPFAGKYNLLIRTTFHEDDTTAMAQTILQQKGVVLVVWEHSRLAAIAHSLGVKDDRLHWHDDDYDSMWIVTFVQGVAVLSKEKEIGRASC